MSRPTKQWVAWAMSAALCSAPLLACQELPGTRTQQAMAVGGAAGAALGYALNEENRLVGALLGGALGAGGGWVIGARTDWFDDASGDAAARDAIDDSRRSPVDIDDVARARTADIDDNGFVTFDEMVAMERAGLSDDEILARLRATGQVFDLTRQQERALIDAGLSPNVVREMEYINADERDRILSRPS
jgi:hypothetical protein